MMHPSGIQAISRKAIETIRHCGLDIHEDQELQRNLLAANSSPALKNAAFQAETTFTLLTKKTECRGEEFKNFLNGWQATHITALYVAGLIVRLQRKAQEARQDGHYMKAELLNESAFHMGEIIAEDTGAVGRQHGAMYEDFAKALCGNDSWKTAENSVPACDEFRAYIAHARLRAPVEDAILTTAASEVWNTGEYSYAAPLTRKLMESRNVERPVAANAYVAVHAGDTELDHFTHALKAWQLYCAAEGMEARPEKAAYIFVEYAARLGPAFSALTASLRPEPTLSARLTANENVGLKRVFFTR